MVFLRSLGTGLVAGAILGSLQTAPAAASPNPASHEAARSSARKPPASADPYLWLEDVTGKRALAWVEKRNAETKRELAKSDSFRELNTRIREILDSDARIPYIAKLGDSYYNFWKDPDHPRGLWRRTSLAQYRTLRPGWETVLDLDSLSKVDRVAWVWEGAIPLPPEYQRCLVQISRGGSDAHVVREFDLTTKSFVPGGFSLPEAKSQVAWRSLDTLYVGTDFGPGSLTQSGYNRIVKTWKRGMPLESATSVFEGKPTDVDVNAVHSFTPGYERDLVTRDVAFYNTEAFVQRGEQWVKLDKPSSADAGFFREWLLLSLRDPWKLESRTWPAGALLAIPLDSFLAGRRDFDMLFEPAPRRSLSAYAPTQAAILLTTLDNIRTRILALHREGGRWATETLPGVPEFGSSGVQPVDPLRSDDYFLNTTNFLMPSSLSLGTVGHDVPDLLKHAPSFFDTTGLEVTQHEAVSKDGTEIPYFQVSRRGMPQDGTAPTLMTGYGGFEIPFLPFYSGSVGLAWLSRGGTFVTANIRGGGEFGPEWHQAAVKAERHHTYEDFIAVAEDLIRRKVTSPPHLGAIGGSNGGLLVGNMLTMRPDLWGAIVCQAPLLDMRRYHKLLAGASWEAEYGNPDDPKEWQFMRAWSPYQNLQRGVKYPPVLFTTSTRDDRVHPGHARKMAARMLAMGDRVLFYENVEGGHPGSATNEQQAFMLALAFDFLWRHLK